MGSFRRIVGATLKDADIDLDKIREEFNRMQRLDQPTDEEQKTLQLLRLFLYYNSSDIEGKGSQNIKELFEMGIENKSTVTNFKITFEDRKKIKKLVNYKIANDFLECKIESQEHPKNIPSGGNLNAEGSKGKLDDNYSIDDAKSDLEFAFGKKPFCSLEDQYHSMKNIFQAGISIRRDKDHPHLVDIVRVISEGEEENKSPNIQFVAIKGQGDDDGKITLTINEEGNQKQIANICDTVFFRKVELKDDGNVVFNPNIYYDSAKQMKSFRIDQIIPEDCDKTRFLQNLGMLKIRATNVKMADNQIEVRGSKISALDKSETFQEHDLQPQETTVRRHPPVLITPAQKGVSQDLDNKQRPWTDRIKAQRESGSITR